MAKREREPRPPLSTRGGLILVGLISAMAGLVGRTPRRSDAFFGSTPWLPPQLTNFLLIAGGALLVLSVVLWLIGKGGPAEGPKVWPPRRSG